MKQNNNWCCWITTKTFKLFREKKLYENSIERMDIFRYWKEISFDKQLCEKCQKLTEKEEIRIEADSKVEFEEFDRERRECDNCGKIRTSKKEHELEKYRWCSEHGKVDRCVILSSDFCSLKCLKVAKDEIKQYWLRKLTDKDLNQEIRKRKNFPQRESVKKPRQ